MCRRRCRPLRLYEYGAPLSLIHEDKFNIPMKSAAALCSISQLRDGSERESERAVSAIGKRGCVPRQPLTAWQWVFCQLFATLVTLQGGMAEEERRSPRGARSKGYRASSAEGD